LVVLSSGVAAVHLCVQQPAVGDKVAAGCFKSALVDDAILQLLVQALWSVTLLLLLA
jgi:hypothetical protein